MRALPKITLPGAGGGGFAVTVLGSDSDGVADTTGNISGFVTANAPRLYLIFASWANNTATVTPSVAGLTFVQQAIASYTPLNPDRHMALFRATGTINVTAASCTFPSTSDKAWVLLEIAGVPTTNNGVDAIVRTSTATHTNALTITAGTGPVLAANSMFKAGGEALNPTNAAETLVQDGATSGRSIAVARWVPGSTALGWTDLDSASARIGVELALAA